MRQPPTPIGINWTGIICLALLVFVVVIIARSHGEIAAFLGTMGRIGPGHTTDDKVIGLIAFGLIVVTIVGLVAVLSRGPRE